MESVKGFLEELDYRWSLPSNVVIGGANDKYKSPVAPFNKRGGKK
ncbi:MAG: hypothetical protein ACXWMH_10620 [Syntrophales bacterium]